MSNRNDSNHKRRRKENETYLPAGYDGGAIADLIENILQEMVSIAQNGCSKTCTAFEAILMALWIKSLKGNARAIKVLTRYERYASEKPWDDQMLPVLKTYIKEEGARLYAKKLRHT